MDVLLKRKDDRSCVCSIEEKNTTKQQQRTTVKACRIQSCASILPEYHLLATAAAAGSVLQFRNSIILALDDDNLIYLHYLP